LVGNRTDADYYDTVQKRCAALGPLVTLAGRCDSDELQRRYHEAHILP
jgi:hypothetical protein